MSIQIVCQGNRRAPGQNSQPLNLKDLAMLANIVFNVNKRLLTLGLTVKWWLGVTAPPGKRLCATRGPMKLEMVGVFFTPG